MFESAELAHAVSKETYRREEAKLRAQLLDAQYDLTENGRFPVLVLIAGVEGAGKGETVNLLNEWMDPRHVLTHGFAEPSDEERERPHLWRFWKALPPKGKVGVFFGAWHTEPIMQRVYGRIDAAEFSERSTRSSGWRRCCATKESCCSSTGFTSRAARRASASRSWRRIGRRAGA